MSAAGLVANRIAIWPWLSNLSNLDIGILTNTGAPTDGTSGTFAGHAGKGCLLLDVTNGVLYINTGTKASPTWNTITTAVPSVLSADGAISPSVSATYVITKASAAALTLAAPANPAGNGTTITITSNTAFAHVLTATGLLQTGSAAVNTATFNNVAGASLTLMAYSGKWNVISANGISFA